MWAWDDIDEGVYSNNLMAIFRFSSNYRLYLSLQHRSEIPPLNQDLKLNIGKDQWCYGSASLLRCNEIESNAELNFTISPFILKGGVDISED